MDKAINEIPSGPSKLFISWPWCNICKSLQSIYCHAFGQLWLHCLSDCCVACTELQWHCSHDFERLLWPCLHIAMLQYMLSCFRDISLIPSSACGMSWVKKDPWHINILVLIWQQSMRILFTPKSDLLFALSWESCRRYLWLFLSVFSVMIEYIYLTGSVCFLFLSWYSINWFLDLLNGLRSQTESNVTSGPGAYRQSIRWH